MTSLSASLLLLGLTLTPSAAADVATADVATRVDTVDPSAPDGVLPDDSQPWHALTETASGLRIHAFRTGWVRVKTPHREFGGPAALRLPAVLASGTWADWMPIISYAVEHPDGIVLVDTGMDPGLNDVDHFGEDERNGWFYRKNLRFFLGRGGWPGDRLEQTARGGIAGVSEHPHDAEAPQELLQRLVEEGVTVLPAHDASVFQRL